MNLTDQDQKYVWHPFEPLQGSASPILIREAKGIYLETVDGRKIIDAVSSWWVNIHGHSNTIIAEAIAEQARKLEHVIFAGFTHEPAIALSANLLSVLPKNQSKVFFSDDGSTAVEVALKLSFQYWHNIGKRKNRVIAIDGAYHGDTFGSMSVGERGIFTAPFNDLLFDVQFIPFPTKVNESTVIEEFENLAADPMTGTFIFEPLIQGAAGMRMYSAELLDRLIAIAHRHGILCIADEVFTGFFRTGKFFACDHLKNSPDIIALSKGITGGALPLGVTTMSENVVSAFRTDDFSKTFFHGHSYTANPLACSAANASFSLLKGRDCQQRIMDTCSLQQQFALAIRNHCNVFDARCLGTILAVEVKTSGSTAYDNDMRKKIYPFFLSRDILLRPLGNVIYVVPPYVILPEELKRVHSAIGEFLDSIK